METPVQILIKEFNGVRPLARAVHRDAASISRWQKSGLVPTNMQKKVLETGLLDEDQLQEFCFAEYYYLFLLCLFFLGQ